MRPQGVFSRAAVRSVDLQDEAGAGFRQTLPGIAGKLGLFVSAELVGETADDPAGTQSLRRHDNGFEHVSRRDYDKMNGLAFFFRHGHCRRKQFLLVVVKDLAGFKNCAAAKAVLPMVEPGAHDDHILAVGVRVGEHLPEIVKIARVAYRDQNVTRTHAHGAATQFLVAINPELVELLGLAVTFAGGAPLRISKQHEKNSAEADAGDSSFVLGEQVYDCCGEKNQKNNNYTERDFLADNPQVPGDLPLPWRGFGIPQHQHRQSIQGETPDHAESV